MENKEKAKLFREIAELLETGFVPGYWSPGGLHDGESCPDSFDVQRTVYSFTERAKQLEAENKKLES